MAQQENWLTTWIKGSNKHKRQHDEDENPSTLFSAINDLRKPDIDLQDHDAIERAKYSDGFFGHIAGSKVFEFTTLGMICCNALAIGVDADYSARIGKRNSEGVLTDNLNEGPVGFICVEYTFAIYFTAEVLIRFIAYKKKLDCFFDAWFVFDSCLVTMMVIETWVLPFLGSGGPLGQLSILRLLRLLRITRMARLMRAVPEMMVIIKGMVAATRTVVCTGALLCMVLYTFSILFTDAYHEKELPDGEEEPAVSSLFGTMGKSMFSLFIYGTVLDDVTAAANGIRASGNNWMMAAFIIFILISSFMMLNMLIGVLVEVVGNTAEGEREKAIELNVREAISEIFDSMDKDSDREISRKEFFDMQNNKNVMDALEDLNIDSQHFHLYAELFFRPEENGGKCPNICYEKLVGMILRLRPGSFVSALDFAAFSKAITGIHDRVKDRVLALEEMCATLAAEESGEILALLPRPDANCTPLCAPPSAPALLGVPDSEQKEAGLAPPSPCDNISTFNGARAPAMAIDPVVATALSESDRERLEQTASTDIIAELQRRLGMPDLEQSGVPYSMMDEDLQNHVKAATDRAGMEGFMMLGVPQDDDDDDNDSGTVYV